MAGSGTGGPMSWRRCTPALRGCVASRHKYANQSEKSEMSDTRSERSSLIAARSGVGLSDDLTTVVAVGVVAATLAAVCHETLGHGLGCVVDGGQSKHYRPPWLQRFRSIWHRTP